MRNRDPLPDAPAHLEDDTRAWWTRAVSRWHLDEHHVRLLTAAAKTWDRLREAERRLDTEGLTVSSRQGEKANPLIRVENDLRVVFARLLRELDLDVEAPMETAARPPKLRSIR